MSESKTSLQVVLVGNRVCGPCNACCNFLKIDHPELKKAAGTRCPHCAEKKGCAIYDHRPSPCRDWYCAWRSLPQLDENWRPDNCGMVLEWEIHGIPQDFSGPALKFTLLNDEFNRVLWPPFVNFVTGAISARKPIFLQVLGRQGDGVMVFLNREMTAAASQRDTAAVSGLLQKAVEVAFAELQAKQSSHPAP